MRKYVGMVGVLVLLAVGLRTVDAAQGWQYWPARMQVLGAALTQLMLDASSEARFSLPENAGRIDTNIQLIADHAHQLQQSKLPTRPDADASISLIMGLLADEMRNAHEKFLAGNYQYARETIRSVTSYCISCHTRDNSGPAVLGAAQLREAKKLSRGEQAEFYAAIRQYDHAFDLFADVVADHRVAERDPIAWRRALLYGLALTVRVQQHPAKALRLIDGALHNPWIDASLRRDVVAWQQALKIWDAAPAQPIGAAAAPPQQLQHFLRQARAATASAADLRGAVWYLRATAVAHGLLRTAAPGAATAELLSALGECYERVQDMQLWSLHELYYDACIQSAPHSRIARHCLQRYRTSLEASFSGSAGVDLPLAERTRLQQLQQLAR